MASFCTQCGSPVDAKFCRKCGALVEAFSLMQPAAAAASSAGTPAPPSPTPAAPVQTQGSGVLAKVLLTVFILIVLVVMTGLGSCAYLAYRAKKKADQVQQALKSGDLNRVMGTLGVGSSGSSGTSDTDSSRSAPLSFPAWNPSESSGTTTVGGASGAAGSAVGTKIPLRPGLTVVTAVAQFGGDYESIKRIQEISANSVRLSYRADNMPNPLQGLQKLSGAPPEKSSGSYSGYRIVRTEDLRSAHDYALIKISYPPSAADQMSAGAPGQPGGQGQNGGGDAGSASGAGGAGGGGGGAGAGAGGGGGAGSGGGAGAGGGSGSQQIEQELKQEGKADVYGIYFDFASDQLKPESELVIQEIAETLRHNPTWKLHVEGHTDNIGGDDYNMDLSQRRAQAVKQALVTRYHIAEDRLTPQGFGATRPKEPNDTLAGRARNRRVELVRQ